MLVVVELNYIASLISSALLPASQVLHYWVHSLLVLAFSPSQSFPPFLLVLINSFKEGSLQRFFYKEVCKDFLFFISLDYVYRYLCWVWLIVLDWPLDINYVMYSILLLWVDHVGFVVLVPEWDDLGPSVHPILVEEILKNASRNFLYLLNFWEA